jgi:YD repeat-containing protein
VGLVALPAATSADPTCTDTWTGGASDGLWQSAGNWSTGVPSSSDVACIGSGVSVQVSGGTNQVGSVQDEGALTISGGSLELTDASNASSVTSLELQGGSLTGAGTLDVSEGLSWTGGTMSGSGSTVLESGSTSSINPGSGSSVALTERTLTNHGTLTWSTGSVEGRSDAEIDNSGTLVANAQVSAGSYPYYGLLNKDGSDVWLESTGTVKKEAGSEFTQIQFQFDNEGTVEVGSGQIIFTGGSHGSNAATGAWKSEGSGQVALNAGSYLLGSGVQMSGEVYLAGGDVQASDIQAPDVTLWLWSGDSTLELTDASTPSHVGTLNVQSNTTLSGAGTLDVSEALSWTGGTMSGAGATALESGATGSINPGSGSSVALTERTLTNHGTLTWSTGSVEGRSNAEIDNSGTFEADANVSGGSYPYYGLLNKDASNVWVHNTGTIKKAAGTEFTQIQFQIDNEGTVEAKTGQIIFTGGSYGGTEASGTWTAEAASISFNSGSYLLGSDVHVSGPIYLAGGNVQVSDIQGSSADMVLWSSSSTLNLTDASTQSHVGSLEVHPNTTLTGAGTLDVGSSLVWGGSSTMSGSGSTVLGSSATGSIEASSGCEPMSLIERKLVNEGTLTFGWGTWFLSEGAELQNEGIFRDNSESSCYGPQIQIPSGSQAPSILNTGSFEKTAGGGTSTVDVNFGNQGVVEAKTGTLDFGEGGIPEEVATGSWAVQSGAHIVLSGGTFLIGEAVDLSAVEVSGATVERAPVAGPPKGHLDPLPYASQTVSVSGVGSSVGTGFSSAGIEITPAGEGEWHSLCGPLTPGLVGEFSCSWDTTSGLYADGKYQLRAQLSDGSEPPDAAPTAAITVLVDNAPPTGSVSATSYLAGSAAPVSGTAVDGGSGVASWQLQITQAGKAEWANACSAQTTPTSGSTYRCDVNAAGDGDGAYELRAIVTDNAGNEYTSSAVDTTVDNTPPTGTLDQVSEAEYVRGTLSLQGTAGDTGSGVASWTPQVAPAGTSWWTNVCSPQSTPISGSTYGCSLNTDTLTDGEYEIRAEMVDNAGNVYTTTTQSLTADNTAPTGSLHALPRYSNGVIEVRGPAADATSGLAGWQLEVEATGSGEWQNACLEQTMPGEGGDYGCSIDTTLLADGSYELHAVITDRAGNSYTTRQVTTRFDNSTPHELSSCDDTWTGGAGDGKWNDTGNWSTASLPSESERACIPAEATVDVDGGSNQAASLDDEGSVVLSGGSLELTALEASSASTLSLTGGTLNVAGELDVSSSLTGEGGGHPTISGSGSVVIESGATGTINALGCGSGGGDFFLSEVALSNQGTLTFGEAGGGANGDTVMSNGAQLQNSGTLNADVWSNDVGPCNYTNYSFVNAGGAAPSITNTGTFNMDVGSGNAALVSTPFYNDGTVDVQSGTTELSGGGSDTEGAWSTASGAALWFTGGSFSPTGDTWSGSGTFAIMGATVSATSLHAGGGHVSASGSTLEVPSGTSTIGDLSIGSSTLNIAGKLDVSSSFASSGSSTVSGSGELAMESGTTGTVEGCQPLVLNGATLHNGGTITTGTSGGSQDGEIRMEDGAQLENAGTFNEDTYDNGPCWENHAIENGGGATSSITNTGTFNVDSGSGNTSQVGVPLSNEGTIHVESGAFSPTVGETGGTWTTSSGGEVSFTGSTGFTLADADASGAKFVVSGGTLNVAGGTSTVGDLSLTSGTLSVAGELDVSSSFTGEGGGHPTISGSGNFVIKSGATGTIDDLSCSAGGGDFHLSNANLMNQGTLTLGVAGGGANGDIVMSEGAQVQNSGTLNADAWSNDAGPCNNTNYSFYDAGGATPSVTNTGTFNVDVGSGNTILSNVPFGNEGTVNVESGAFSPTAGEAGGTWTTSGEGEVSFTGSTTFALAGADASGAKFVLSSGGTLNVASGTSTVGELITSGGTLSIAGELDISSTFTGIGNGRPTISGSGSFVIKPGASGTVDSTACGSGGGDFLLSSVDLMNEGTLTLGVAGGGPNGDFLMSDGAQVQNSGTLNVDSWSNDIGPCNYTSDSFADGGGSAPSITNTGTFQADVGSGNTANIGVPFENQGTVSTTSGTMEFSNGGVSEEVSTGVWHGPSGNSLRFTGGTFLVEEGSEFDVNAEDATVIWIGTTLIGVLEAPPDVTGTVTIPGSGERGVDGTLASAEIEITPEGTSEWQELCGSLSLGLGGEFSCSWDTTSGSSYPDGHYQLRVKLSSSSSPPETAFTPTVSVLVDNTAPTGSLTAPSGDVGGWPTITGSASDSGSEVQSWQLQIAVEGSSEWVSACPAQSTPISGDSYGCTVDTTTHTDGSYQLRAVITDRAGNTDTTATVATHIDNAAPTGTLGTVSTSIGKTVDLSGTASSTGPAVASWTVQIAPAGTSAWTNACPSQTVPVSGSEYGCEMDSTAFADGEYQLRAVITDVEGDTSSTAPVSTTIDNTSPRGSLFTPRANVAGSIEVQGYAYDAGSGVASWTLQVAPAGSEAFEEACLSQTLPISGLTYGCDLDTTGLADGSYKLRAVITDNAGNTYTTPVLSTTVENTTLSLTTAPAISGETVSGQALSASSGSWSGGGTIAYTYQWQSCNASATECANIEGATGTGYVLGAGNVGGTLRVVVSASNGLESQSTTSSPSAVIEASAISNTSLPTISGSAHTNVALSADPGRWRGAAPIAYTYQWQSCNASGAECANIEGATDESYTPGEGDVSSTLRVVVSTTNSEGSASATSAASAAIAAGSSSGIRYLYDEAGRLHIVDDPAQGAAVYQWDADGNLTKIERYSHSTLAVLVVTPPHAPPGTQVDITGTGFSSEASEDEVSFDGTSATVSKATATDLIVTVPEGAGTGTITVTVGADSADGPGSFTPLALTHSRLPAGIHPSSATLAPALVSTTSAPVASAPSQRAPTSILEKSTVKRARSAKRSIRRARHARHAGHKRAHAKAAKKIKHKKTQEKKTKKSAVKEAQKPAAAGRATAAATPSSSQGTAVPQSVSDYRSPYSATWDPTGKNRIGGDWVTGRRASPWASLPALAAPRATTGLSGQALSIDGSPVVNVTLSIQGTSKQIKTDGSGRFLLEKLPAGHQILDIDGRTADTHELQYGQFSVGVELTKDKTTALGYTIWMTPLDSAGNQTIASPTRHESVLTNPKIPGLEVHLPAGTIIREANGKIVHKLNMTAIPVDRPPFPLPLFATGVPTYFTVQPGRAYLSKGAQIIYPNWGHLPPGQRVEFWNYDPADKGWYVYGKGSVSSNGKQVIPDPDVRIWEFTGAMLSTTNPPATSAPPSGGGTTAGDPVDLASGLFVYNHTDLDVSDSMMPIGLTRTYRPGDSNSYAFGIGTQDPFDLHIWSNENYRTAYIVESDGGKVKLQRTSPGGGYTEAVYATVETSGPWEGAILKWDTSEGGWELRRHDGMKFYFPDYDPVRMIEDRNGNRITLVREGGGNGPVKEVKGPHGQAIYLSHDGYNRITEAVDSAGQAVQYRYDSAGRLAQVIDPTGGVTRYTYNSANDMTRVTDARGNVLIANTFNTSGQVVAQTLGGKGTYTFHRLHTCPGCEAEGTSGVEAIDPNGNKRDLYFTHWLPTAEVRNPGAEEQWTNYTHDSTGNITKIASSTGDTSLTYNSAGDVTSTTNESSTLEPLTTRSNYNEFDEPTSVTDPLGRTTSDTYDSKGNLISATNPMGQQTTFEYDGQGERTSVTNPQDDTTTFSYENGNQVAITNSLGHKTEASYDAVGLPTAITDAEGKVTHFAYDGDNELVSETDPAGDMTSYGYDADSNLTSVADPEGHIQTGTYNSFDELTSWTNALNKTTSYEYDGLAWIRHEGELSAVWG